MSTSPRHASPEVANAIVDSFRPALDVVFEGIEVAKIELDRLVEENNSLKRLSLPDAVHQYVSLGRFLLRSHLVTHEKEMGSWRLNEKVTSNGAIMLHDGLQHVRFLHQRDKNSTPHAGLSRARIDYFTNSSVAVDPGLLDAPQNLLMLWQIWNPRESRLVHTLSAGSYLRSPLVDLDVSVLQTDADFADVRFNGDLSAPLEHFDELGIDDLEFGDN